MAELGKYLYCIISCPEERSFDAVAIGDAGSTLYTVGYQGLAVVVSDSPITRYQTTRQNMMAHEKVQERVMQEFVLLPVRFGTVTDPASPVEDIQRLLGSRFEEFSTLLKDMEGKVELGLKAFWRDEKAIFAEILAENAGIRRLRNSLIRKPPEAIRFDGIALGQMVKEALERKRAQEAARLLAPLRRLALQVKENPTLADRVILNAAFLVEKAQGQEFDRAVSELDEGYGKRIGFKYVGPTPPYNFVDIVVDWEEVRGFQLAGREGVSDRFAYPAGAGAH